MTAPEHDHETGRLLQAALTAEADTVSTDPTALQRIQRRTDSSPSPWRWPLVSAGAGLATAAVITAVVLASGDTSSPPRAADDPRVEKSGMHQGVYDPGAAESAQVTMYYAGPRPGNPEGRGAGDPADLSRLYAEPHTVEQPDDEADVAAVREFLTSRPIDPDYESGWPEGVDVTEITDDGGVTTIALEGDADLGTTPTDMDCQGFPRETAAAQAILRTAGVESAASFTYNGESVPVLFNCIDVSPSVAVMPDVEIRANITIDNIVEGQTVSNPVTAKVSGNTFEANLNWQLLDADGRKLDDGFTMVGSYGEWAQADIELGNLELGTYTFKALEYSAADGDPINVDDKTFTVE